MLEKKQLLKTPLKAFDPFQEEWQAFSLTNVNSATLAEYVAECYHERFPFNLKFSAFLDMPWRELNWNNLHLLPRNENNHLLLPFENGKEGYPICLVEGESGLHQPAELHRVVPATKLHRMGIEVRLIDGKLSSEGTVEFFLHPPTYLYKRVVGRNRRVLICAGDEEILRDTYQVKTKKRARD